MSLISKDIHSSETIQNAFNSVSVNIKHGIFNLLFYFAINKKKMKKIKKTVDTSRPCFIRILELDSSKPLKLTSAKLLHGSFFMKLC